jgi:hypothetical protein
MAESAALLVDDVLPHEPIRQWVLSFPFQLRFLFASQDIEIWRCTTVHGVSGEPSWIYPLKYKYIPTDG